MAPRVPKAPVVHLGTAMGSAGSLQWALLPAGLQRWDCIQHIPGPLPQLTISTTIPGLQKGSGKAQLKAKEGYEVQSWERMRRHKWSEMQLWQEKSCDRSEQSQQTTQNHRGLGWKGSKLPSLSAGHCWAPHRQGVHSSPSLHDSVIASSRGGG